MKRQCSDPTTFTNTTSAADNDDSAVPTFIDDHQFYNPNYISYPQLNFAETNIPVPTRIQPDPKPNNHSDGGSIEMPRRRRGRPLGSKNKPKSPNQNPTRIDPRPDPDNQVNVNLPNHNNYSHQILEIPNDVDVIQSIAKYAVLHNTSFRVLHTSGSVRDVIIRQPNNHLHPKVPFYGRYDVVSLSAVFIIPTSFDLTQSAITAFNDVAIKLSFGKGEIGGGIVVGPLIAWGSVFVLVEPILNLTYQRLEDVSQTNVNTTSSADMVLNGEMCTRTSFMT